MIERVRVDGVVFGAYLVSLNHDTNTFFASQEVFRDGNRTVYAMAFTDDLLREHPDVIEKYRRNTVASILGQPMPYPRAGVFEAKAEGAATSRCKFLDAEVER